MAQPTPYSLSYDFTAFQVANPTTPLPADKIEVEYNNISSTIGQILANLVLIQRDDGELANGSVGIDQLAPNLLAYLGAGEGDIATVAGIADEVTAVAAIDDDVTAVANIASDVTVVANIASAVSAVAAIDSDVTAVASNIANVSAVGGYIANVNTVAGIAANVTSVAGNATNINIVAGLQVEITRLALISGAISNVDAISANVTTVAGIASDVTAVAGIAANVTSVANIAANVTTVAGIASDVTAVAANATNINAVAANATNINAVAANETNINTVAGAIAAVNTVSTNIANVNIVVANIATITEAANNIPQANRTATTDPTVNDDTADGYSEASIWVNTTSDEIFFCADPALGAAVWISVAGVITLDSLDDVSFITLATGDMIRYSGSEWENRTAAQTRTDLGLGTMAVETATDYALKSYVDGLIAGLFPKDSCKVATTGALTGTYLNGASGVGATFTFTSTGVNTVDGVALALGDRILLKNQASAFENGIYIVTTAGALGVAGILTRATGYDTSSEIFEGTYTIIEEGTANTGTLWIMTHNGTITVGTTDIDFTQLTVATVTDPELAAIAGLTSAANTVPVFTGSGTAALITLGASQLVGRGQSGNATNITLSGLSMVGDVLTNDKSITSLTSGTLAAGVGSLATSNSYGTVSSGTVTPAPLTDGNFGHYTNNGAHTLAPPTGVCTIILEVLNGASAGTITTSGFTKVDVSAYNTTNTNKFHFFITKTNSYSSLSVVALQ